MKIFFTALCSLLLSFTVQSQELSYGPVIGVAFLESGNDNSSNNFSAKNITNLNVGAYIEYNFNKNLGIKTEVAFNKRDLDYNYRIYRSGVNVDGKYKMSLLEISPSLKYDFGQE